MGQKRTRTLPKLSPRDFDGVRVESNGLYYSVCVTRGGVRHRSTLGPKAEWDDTRAAMAAGFIAGQLGVDGLPQRPIPDGPRLPNVIRVDGEDHAVPLQVYRLLELVWGAETMPMSRVIATVWPDEPPQDGTVRALVSSTNSLTLQIGLPWRLRVKAESLVVERAKRPVVGSSRSENPTSPH